MSLFRQNKQPVTATANNGTVQTLVASGWDVSLVNTPTGTPVVALTLQLADSSDLVTAALDESGAAAVIRKLQEIRWQVCALEAQLDIDNNPFGESSAA
jgi:hypothetical protein